MPKDGRKLTRKDGPAYAHVDRAGMLRRIAGMYYTSDGENPEPCRAPEPELPAPRAPKRDQPVDRVTDILTDLKREGYCWENEKPRGLELLVYPRYRKRYPNSSTPSKRTMRRARDRLLAK